MSDQNPYEKLGVNNTRQPDARNHLLQQYSGDPKRLETVEAKHDAT